MILGWLLHDRFDGALGETPPSHLRADDEDDARDRRRKDHRVGHRQHRWRVDDDPVERSVRQIRQQRLHPFGRKQL